MLTMPTGAGVERWCRLLLIVLLALPIPAAIGLYADDGSMVVSDPAESDERWLRLAAGAPSDAAWILPSPLAVRRAVRPDPRDLVVAGRTCLTPTDRAPPRG
jgi:hypothetical protein